VQRKTVGDSSPPAVRREFVQGLERGFAVMKAFAADRPRLTVAEVAARTQLTRAVARRYLLTLQELGYVVQDRSVFALTPRILDLGFTYLATIDVASIAQPYMERVVHELRESCSVAVLDGHDAVYVARVAAKRIMSINLVVGSRLPAHATSMGKVLLAHVPPAQLDEYFRTARLTQLTPRTISSEDALRAALQQVRERGWAFADQESEEGVRTVAVPLFDRDMQVHAAMNVSGHASRVSMKELRSRYLPVLREAAADISRALGARPPAARGAEARMGVA
jgi:IclR family transcriptional regulator, pca regulon regulatory protein